MSAAGQKSPELAVELAAARARKAAALRILRGWPDRLRTVSIGDGQVQIETSPDVCLQLAGLLDDAFALRDNRAGVEDDLRRARLALADLEAHLDRLQRQSLRLWAASSVIAFLCVVLAGGW